MKKTNSETLITGLWKQERDGKVFYIGRINPSLNAIVIENKNKRSGKNDPTHLLYFFNGSTEEAKENFLGEQDEQEI